MARKSKPITVTIGGRRRHIVHRAPAFWTEQLADGQLVHHAGKFQLDQPQAKWLATPKPCSRCKQPCQTATPLGRAVHDSCEGYLNVLPDEIEAQIIFGVAVDLGAQLITGIPNPSKEIRHVRHAA